MPGEQFDNRSITPLEAASLTLIPCDPKVHGSFIRALTKDNFYDMMSRTIGWDEERHQQEPRFPERYRMVQKDDQTIGFFCIREAADHLYLHTIQLAPAFRHRGYGTALLRYIETIAKSKHLSSIRLSVFEENPAQLLYRRLGYVPVEAADDRSLILMEKRI